MSFQYLEMGVVAIQNGSVEEGARLLKLAIQSPELTNQLRAVAYMWLAETLQDPQQKRVAYQEALNADPENADIRQRVTQILSSQLPPPPPTSTPPPPQSFPQQPQSQSQPSAPPPPSMPEMPSTTPPPPQQNPSTSGFSSHGAGYQPPPQQPAAQPPLQQTGTVLDYMVTVIGGPNGTGTGFYPTQHTLIATTRHITGGADRLTIEHVGGRQSIGTVVRTFSDYDLALIRVEFNPPGVLPISSAPTVPDEAPLTIVAHNGQAYRAAQRPTRRVMAAHWIPTNLAALPDAGGDPIFDEQNNLCGMITHNTSRNSNYYFGVTITRIRQCVDQYLAEVANTKVSYCPQCGSNSRAGGIGFFYCETCGSVTPAAATTTRYPIPQAEAYYTPADARGIQCTNCTAATGFYNGACLRCGHVQNPAQHHPTHL